MYVWAPQGASVVALPTPGFRVGALAWAPHGACLLLTSVAGDAFCCAYWGAPV